MHHANTNPCIKIKHAYQVLYILYTLFQCMFTFMRYVTASPSGSQQVLQDVK